MYCVVRVKDLQLSNIRRLLYAIYQRNFLNCESAHFYNAINNNNNSTSNNFNEAQKDQVKQG